MKIIRWMLFGIIVLPVIWLACGVVRLWELVTGKRFDLDNPKRLSRREVRRWLASKRAQEAARLKTEQQQPK
jgi:hypothetical protein